MLIMYLTADDALELWSGTKTGVAEQVLIESVDYTNAILHDLCMDDG